MALSDMWSMQGQFDRYGNPIDSRPQHLQNIYSTAEAAPRWAAPGSGATAPARTMPTGRDPYSAGLVNPIYDLPYTGSLPTVDPNSRATPLSLGGVNTAFQSQRQRGNGVMDMRAPLNRQFYSGLGLDPTLAAMSGYRNGSSAGEFRMNHGVDAFLGGYGDAEFGGGYTTNPGMDGQVVQGGAGGGIGALQRLAAQTGFADANRYADSEQGKRALFDDLNNHLRDYWGVSGKDPNASYGDRAATRTLYRDNGSGQLQAVSNPRVYGKAPSDNGFIGRESLTALSMALPMFGGWAGMLGQGAAGTLSAGSGLGLTTGLGGAIGTGATNALLNAGMGALTSGSGGRGFLTGLLGQGINAGIGSLTGGANNLGNLFNTANPGASSFNPMSAFRDNLGRLGLGNSPIGGVSRFAPQAMRGLSSLFSS